MAKKQFKTESKQLLNLMIYSIYTHKEIFLRELISNASDAIDKIYFKTLTDEKLKFNRDDYYMKIIPDKVNRTLCIMDTGIGMTKEELEENLGIIARSGSQNFKEKNKIEEGYDLIGQFGVGFYSAFMVAEKVTVMSKAFGAEEAYKWESEGVEGYTVTPCEKDQIGTEIILKIKTNTPEENYDEFLEEYRLRSLIKEHSDFIRYPINMEIHTSRAVEGKTDEYETIVEEEILNSMIPLWRKNASELKKEDYEKFYNENHFGMDNPLAYIHEKAEGIVQFNMLLFIPERPSFDFYSKEFEKGLELYSNGVLIMKKCSDLLPDYFSFVRGSVESEDLALNISREMLQHNRQLKLIAKQIRKNILKKLTSILKNAREKYEIFFKSFGTQLKYGIYSSYGNEKEDLQDLLLFYSSKERKMVTLDEYTSRMKEDQNYIYYAAGDSIERIEKMPQAEMFLERDFEILYLIDDVDEFLTQVLHSYKDKEFKSISDSDTVLEDKAENDEDKPNEAQDEALLKAMKEFLGDKVKDVRFSKRLKTHPVCLSSEGEVSIEMEKILKNLSNNQEISAQKVLEINTEHAVYKSLKDTFENDQNKFQLFTGLLYNQALLVEGLSVEDPLAFSNAICQLMN